MKRACSKSSVFGFTLVELLVMISILAILFSIGLAQYMKFNRQQVLGQAVLGLKNNLAYAREMALSGKKDCEGVFDGILVRFGDAEYSLYSSCNNKTALILITTYKIEQVSLGSYPDEILFKSFTGGTDLSEDETIVLVAGSGGAGNTAGVLVTPAGKLEIVSPSPTPCSGCWSGSVCEAGTTLEECGTGGALCLDCNDDEEECTIDSCVAGSCQRENVDNYEDCDYGNYDGYCYSGECRPYVPTGGYCFDALRCFTEKEGQCLYYDSNCGGPEMCYCLSMF
ncbi:MAG TPA: hypothetical protein VMY36_04030 [Patescibacteria group bacterium]|nr:hypothetical protein [Patescibacteria group bacterium]